MIRVHWFLARTVADWLAKCWPKQNGDNISSLWFEKKDAQNGTFEQDRREPIGDPYHQYRSNETARLIFARVALIGTFGELGLSSTGFLESF